MALATASSSAGRKGVERDRARPLRGDQQGLPLRDRERPCLPGLPAKCCSASRRRWARRSPTSWSGKSGRPRPPSLEPSETSPTTRACRPRTSRCWHRSGFEGSNPPLRTTGATFMVRSGARFRGGRREVPALGQPRGGFGLRQGGGSRSGRGHRQAHSRADRRSGVRPAAVLPGDPGVVPRRPRSPPCGDGDGGRQPLLLPEGGMLLVKRGEPRPLARQAELLGRPRGDPHALPQLRRGADRRRRDGHVRPRPRRGTPLRHFVAALLLDRAILRPLAEDAGPSVTTLVDLSALFKASLQATARQLALLDLWPCAFVFWEEGYRKDERIADNQLPMPILGELRPAST